MSLRRKLILLLSGFAAFAVLAAAATIYALQWRVEGAVDSFQRTMGQTTQVDDLRRLLREQVQRLGELTRGRTEAARPYFDARDGFFTRLRSVVRFAGDLGPIPDSTDTLSLAQALEEESDRCVAMVRAGTDEATATALAERIESELAPPLDAKLRQLSAGLEEMRARAARDLGAAVSRTLFATVVVGGLAACIVVLGALLIRAWLMTPLAGLREAARRFGEGDFAYRVRSRQRDELGELGDALNLMARRVDEASAHLRASEEKHRALFRNLRDAVVICDVEGRVVECHESDTQLLGVDGTEPIGRSLWDVWPEWGAACADWAATLEAAVVRGKRHRATAIRLPRGEEGEAYCDFLVYRAEYGDQKRAVIVARDVTERHRLQSRVRRAETLEAIGTLAGGLAHDFNNLLAGVTGTLSLLANEIRDPQHAERIRTALRACWQAAGLSRRLLNFATSAHGNPQVFRVRDMVELILKSLDSSFLEGITLRLELDDPVAVRMDRDQFTQVVLNLVRNARDAMPDGGALRIGAKTVDTHDPDEGTPPQPYAVLTIADTGLGMTPEVQRRMFEPLFTTKSRTARRGRGLGMAVVYSAVKNAGGFISVDSAPHRGTTMGIHLPISTDPIETDALGEPVSTVSMHGGQGTVLLLDCDPVARHAWTGALQGWGYTVRGAESVDEAVGMMVGEEPGAISLAVVDVHTLDVSGDLAAERLVAFDANLRIILVNGAEDRPIPPALQRNVRAKLFKPFRMEDFATAVAASMRGGT